MSKLKELEKKYPFGSHKVGQFTFTGIDMFQHPNKAITLSQSNYVKATQPIKISQERRKDEEAPITPEEKMAACSMPQYIHGLIWQADYHFFNPTSTQPRFPHSLMPTKHFTKPNDMPTFPSPFNQ